MAAGEALGDALSPTRGGNLQWTRRIQSALGICAEKIGAAEQRLKKLLLEVPESPQEDGLNPEDDLLVDVRGTIENLLEDGLESRKLLPLLDKIEAALAQGWRGEWGWRSRPEGQPDGPVIEDAPSR